MSIKSRLCRLEAGGAASDFIEFFVYCETAPPPEEPRSITIGGIKLNREMDESFDEFRERARAFAIASGEHIIMWRARDKAEKGGTI